MTGRLKVFRSALQLLLVFMFVFQTSAAALTQSDIDSIVGGTAYYDGGDSGSCSSVSGGGGGSTGGDNGATVFSYFTSKGYTQEQAAGIVGNMIHESGIDPLKWEGDLQDHQTPPDPTNTKEGWGIVQWTPAIKILEYASAENKKPEDLTTQMDFLAAQLDGTSPNDSEKAAGDALKAVTATGPDGAVQAADSFEDNYERPDKKAKGYSQSRADREASAKAVLTKYGGGTVTGQGQGGGCSCTPAASASASGQTTIVLDPGHVPGSTPADERDPTTGLYVEDYDNPSSERVDAYNVSQKVGAKLTAAGYNVVNSKKSVDDKFNLGERAARDNAANPALIVVFHGDSSAQVLMYPDKNSTRTPKGSPRTDGTNGLVDPSVEAPSEAAAKIMAPIIKSAMGDSYEAKSFYEYYGADRLGGNGHNIGNTPVQTILTKAPEVYSEMPLSVLGSDQFASAMATAIEKAVPATGASTGGGGSVCSGAVAGNAVATAINYAWPDNKGDPYCKETSAYSAAINQAVANGQYTGADCGTDSSIHGIDCGGFVTRVMIDSGADPGYNYGGDPKKGASNTIAQQKYLNEQVKTGKYENLGSHSSTDGLQPGDIAINSKHTFIYVGKQPGFNENSASASLGTRSPMATPAYFSNSVGDFTWYRLVK